MGNTNLTALQHIVDEHPVTLHPLLTNFGELEKPQVQSWAREQYYLSLSFADTLATLYARVPFTYVEEKRELAHMFYREVRGGNESDSHEAEFGDFASFLELDLLKLRQERPRVYTQRFIEERLAVCTDAPIDCSLAAMALGNEYLNLTIFDTYRKGIQKIEGFEECPVGYFEAHLRDEHDDFRTMNRAFQKVCKRDDGAQLAIKEMLDIRRKYFDELWEDLHL